MGRKIYSSMVDWFELLGFENGISLKEIRR
jgi:hypothetical protein